MQKQGFKYIFSLFSANALQIAFAQLGGLFLFWVASKDLSKNDFGNFNWYFAIYGTFVSLFSFGFDFIVIKRISSRNEMDAARVQFIQNLVICLVSVVPVALIAWSPLLPNEFRNTIFIFVAFQFTYLSMPFKNALTGKELFSRSARAIILSNSVKIILVIVLYFFHSVTLFNICAVLAVCNLLELIVYMFSSYAVFDHTFFSRPGFGYYKKLFKESLPQLGVIVFDSAFARIDWILLGVLSSANAALNTAEYSFAYKIFELSKLPLLVLSPILFTRFSKLFYVPQAITEDIKDGVRSFFKLELIIGMTIPLILNLAWVPLMQFFTSDKYGPENASIYFLLSLTIPIVYMINFLWTIAFAQSQLKLTMSLSIINSCLNIVLNVLLIPKYGQTGAAVSFLACNVIMLPVYIYFVKQSQFKFPVKLSLLITGLSIATGIACYYMPLNFVWKTIICIIIYYLIIYVLGILRRQDISNLKYFITKN